MTNEIAVTDRQKAKTLNDSILAYREQAVELQKMQNMDAAKLYEKLADSLEAELGMQAHQPQGGRTVGNETQQLMNEAMPPETQQPVTGLGGLQ